MQAIADWLKNLGMSEYAQRFAENGISAAALRHLTDQDLKDIGVLLGHRRIMLAAIASTAPREPRADLDARGTAPPTTGGADRMGDGRGAGSAGGACARRYALGRSDHT